MMTKADTPFANWAVVAHKDDTGFGRQAADMRSVLGVGKHIVIPSERLVDRQLCAQAEVLLRPNDPPERVKELLSGLEGIVFFERHSWHPEILTIARELGVATVCVPNWEWFRGYDSEWKNCDFFACPNEFALRVVNGYGFKNAVHLPWCLDLAKFRSRSISGPARVFIHNAGLVDPDDRKGTRDTIEAFKRVRRDDIRLIVRMQKEVPLPALDKRIELQVGNLADPSALYAEGDVAIQPSKMEGIGFMVVEPLSCGMPVITTDHPPMNEFVSQKELRVRTRWFKRKGFPLRAGGVKQALLYLPRLSDLAQKIAWCAEHDLTAISRQNRDWAERTFSPERMRQSWSRVLSSALCFEHASSAQVFGVV